MKSIRWNRLSSGDSMKRLFIACIALLIIFALMTLTLITAYAAANCPNCGGIGEPTGAFCVLCDSCGSCLGCGYACIDCCSEGRRCTECCCEYCGDFCASCSGCLECGSGCHECAAVCDPECPDCEDTPPSGNEPYYPDILDIGDDLLPLFNLFGTPFFFFAPIGIPSWAVISVLFTIAGIVLSIVTILRAVNQKKVENINVDNQCSAMVRNADSFNNDIFIDLIKHKEQYNKRRRLGALISMYVLSIGALIFLLIVQDFKGVIALLDRWVIMHAILFSGVVVCNRLVFRKYDSFSENRMPRE